VTVSARAALALVLLLPLTGGCSLAGRSLGGYVDDHVVKHAVKRRLNVDHVGVARGVKVDTFEGTVYLSGAVDTPAEKSDAENAAWQVEGVQQVVNDLVVRQAQAAPSALPRFHTGDVLSRRIPGIRRVDPGPPGGPGLAYDDAATDRAAHRPRLAVRAGRAPRLSRGALRRRALARERAGGRGIALISRVVCLYWIRCG